MPQKPSARPRNVLTRMLGTGLALLAVLTVLGAVLGSAALAWIDRATSVAMNVNLVDERVAADVYRLVAINSERYKAMALSSEPGVQQSLAEDVRVAETRYRQLLRQLREHAASGSRREPLARVEAADARFAQAAQALRAAVDTNFTPTIQKEYGEGFQPAARALLEAVDALAARQREAIDAAAAGVHQQSVDARWLLAGFALAALVVSAGLAGWLLRRISRPIAFASDTAARVASFDLAQEIRGHARDEAGELLAALGRMQQNLRDLVGQLGTSAATLHDAAGEMAQGNQDLSARTEETASSLDRTATALDQITRTLHASCQGLAHARQRACRATEEAVEGGRLVTELVQRIRAVEDDGARVADIVSVIDGIAFQTNLLALNAAVEAARAGEHGRGFAVVAAEVRQLSSRSAAAAAEVRQLIARSTESTRAGAVLAERAREVVESGVRGMQAVAEDISRIAANTQSQGAGMGEVNVAVARVSEATQQNAALVEESSAAAQQLRAQAESLAHLIGRFVLPSPSHGRLVLLAPVR